MQEPKGRNLLAGLSFYDTSSGMISFLMMILSLFTVTAEVFIRKNMGQRYFNIVNFWAGFIVFSTFGVLINAFAGLRKGAVFNSGISSQQSSYSTLILIIWFLYVAFGLAHLFHQWYKEESGKPIHSLHSGDSRLEPLGKLLIKLANRLLAIPVYFFSKMLPERESEMLPKVLPVFKDVTSFTTRFVEPMFFYVLSVFVMNFSGVVGYWLLFTSMSLLFYCNMRDEFMKHKVLDIRDQMLEAAEVKAAMAGQSDFMRMPHSTKRVLENMAGKVENTPTLKENIKMFNPSIAEAMEAINSRSNKNQSNNKPA